MTVIVDKNMVIKGTGKTTVSSPYLPTEGLLFTYLPNYTNIDSYNIGNRNPSTSTVYTDPTNTSTQYEGIISGKYNLLYEAGGTLPTLKISNNNTLYSMNGDQNTSYFISFWVYFDEFPNSSTGIKRKRTFLLGLDFGINSSISIGVTAPFYLTQSGSEYKYQFSPISFCSIISTPIDSTTGGNRTVSFSTDYKFYKGQWYFITLKLRPNGSQNINQSGDWIVSMYINNNLENTSIYEGN
ncbi:MAG: hypothetical protein KDH96_11715, partial [Candidatus Riesia sp.]|nr:hypothetical protein [Candidatus Riesia sp.]